MSRIIPYKAAHTSKLALYQRDCLTTQRPCLTAITRNTTAFLELNMDTQPLSENEQAVIAALFAEHATRRPYLVTPLYCYCQHLRIDALPLVMRRIEQMLVGKHGPSREVVV